MRSGATSESRRDCNQEVLSHVCHYCSWRQTIPCFPGILEGAKVEGKVLAQVKGEKITVYKYKSKKDSKRKVGHRQPYTKVEITAINA